MQGKLPAHPWPGQPKPTRGTRRLSHRGTVVCCQTKAVCSGSPAPARGSIEVIQDDAELLLGAMPHVAEMVLHGG